MRPLHACTVPMCPNTTPYRYCTAHEHRAISERALLDKERPQSQHRGYGARWKRYRSHYLKANPLCVDPYERHVGRVTPATHVDHVIPHKMDWKLFWDPENHQSLCASCSGYKSAIEQGGRAEHNRPALSSVSGAKGFEWTDEPFSSPHKSTLHLSRSRGMGGEILEPNDENTVRPD